LESIYSESFPPWGFISNLQDDDESVRKMPNKWHQESFMIGIKALELHVLLTVLLVIPVALVVLISMLTFLIGRAPETTEAKNRERG
jgi:hypothetical protein